jgi:hypothetical protein
VGWHSCLSPALASVCALVLTSRRSPPYAARVWVCLQIMYRRMHKKGTLEESQKKKARKVNKSATKAVVGASLELIKAKRNQKPEVRAAAREAALREVKERSKAKQAAKKEAKPKAAPVKQQAPKQSKAAAKATNSKGAKGVRR